MAMYGAYAYTSFYLCFRNPTKELFVWRLCIRLPTQMCSAAHVFCLFRFILLFRVFCALQKIRVPVSYSQFFICSCFIAHNGIIISAIFLYTFCIYRYFASSEAFAYFWQFIFQKLLSLLQHSCTRRMSDIILGKFC